MIVEQETHGRQDQYAEQEAHSRSRTVLKRCSEGDVVVMTEHGEVDC